MRFCETPGGLTKEIKCKNQISDTQGDFRPIGTHSTIKHKRLDCDVAEWLKMRDMGGKKSAMSGIEPSTQTNSENVN